MTTTTNYFAKCETEQQAKELFKKLLLIHHPDKGGDTAKCQELISQFQSFEPASYVDNDGNIQNTENWHKTNFKKYSGVFAEQLQDLIMMDDVILHIVGSWIWVEGINENRITRKIIDEYLTDEYKANFNRTRKLWQVKPVGTKFFKYNGIDKSLDQLKKEYGGSSMKTGKKMKIA